MYPSPPAPIHISMWADDSGEWYWTLQNIDANNYPNVYGCDFNGDGYDEVLFSNSGAVTVLEGTQSGTGSVLFFDESLDIYAAGFGQLDGNPNPDLICWSGDTLYWYQNTLTELDNFESAPLGLSVSLSENPFSAQVTISAPLNATIQVLDLEGRIIETGAGPSYTFTPGNLPGGSYLLRVKLENLYENLKLIYLP